MPEGLGSLDAARGEGLSSPCITALGWAGRPWEQMQEREVKVGACGSSYLIAFYFLNDLEKQSQGLKTGMGI